VKALVHTIQKLPAFSLRKFWKAREILTGSSTSLPMLKMMRSRHI